MKKKIKVIILDKYITNIGNIISVKPGYARNYLIPNFKAVYANDINIKKFSKKYISLINGSKKKFIYKNEIYKKIIKLSPLEFCLRSDDNNKLFCSVKSVDIKNLIFKKLNIKISEKYILFPKGPIKYLGDYIIKINLCKNIIFDFSIKIKKL